MNVDHSVNAYVISNHKGVEATILDHGLVLQSLKLSLPDGMQRETVLGLTAPTDYLSEGYLSNQYPYLGAFIGRYANRISGASFEMDDISYPLFANNGNNCLHGGKEGFDRKRWSVSPSEDGSGITATYISRDGEEGFPGNLTCKVWITISENGELVMRIEAKTDQATPVNLTWHPYFNLDDGSDLVHNHRLQIFADKYLKQADDLTPTGEILSVALSEYDFRVARTLENIVDEGGVDTSFIIQHEMEQTISPASKLVSSDGKVELEVLTDAPVVHVYTGQSLPMLKVSNGEAGPFSGVCLECQMYTDAINKASFPNTILYPGETYRQTIIYAFAVKAE